MKQFCEKHKNDAKRSYYKNLFDEHSDKSITLAVYLWYFPDRNYMIFRYLISPQLS